MNIKTFKVNIKDADQGLVEAVFSTFNVIDHDGDVTLPGAFTDGEAVRISAYGHRSWMGELPVGKGTIRSTDSEAILNGGFFLETSAGRDTFEVVKGLGGLQEWSYGFDVIESDAGQQDGQDVQFLKKLKVHEVSPVLLGAGIDTRTLAVKSGLKFSEHGDSVLTDVRSLINRFEEVITARIDDGKSRLSEHSVELLDQVDAELTRLAQLREPPPTHDHSDELTALHARFLATFQGV